MTSPGPTSEKEGTRDRPECSLIRAARMSQSQRAWIRQCAGIGCDISRENIFINMVKPRNANHWAFAMDLEFRDLEKYILVRH